MVAWSQNHTMLRVMANLRKVESATDNIVEKINSVEGNITLPQHFTIVIDNLDTTITQLNNIRSHFNSSIHEKSS